MSYSPRAYCALSAAIVSLSMAGLPSIDAVVSAQSGGEAKKPSLSLRVTPPVGFAPLRTRLVVDVRDGDDDYADFYCPTVEWDWGDGTVSANSEDCDPYEAGKSSIRRRFSTEHTFRQPGAYRVAFRLKQKDRVVGMSSVNVQVRAGLPQF
ncbi:MAG TPA: hypothetical protein VFS23_42950 [Vicinamibacterales bacterium]|nr:hypothetical protein [Vicinamibacterales bacterium]